MPSRGIIVVAKCSPDRRSPDSGARIPLRGHVGDRVVLRLAARSLLFAVCYARAAERFPLRGLVDGCFLVGASLLAVC